MKKLTVLITYLLFLSAGSAICQNQTKIDSLKVALKNAKDTVKVNVLNQLAKEYCYISPAEAIKHARNALTLSKDLDYEAGVADAYQHVGVAHGVQDNYQLALKAEFKALELNQKLNRQLETGRVFNNLGVIYDEQGHYDKALEFYFKSWEIHESLGDKDGLSRVYNNIGYGYQSQGNYAKALEFHLKSLQINEELGDEDGIAYSYHNMGIIYDFQGDYEQSLGAFFKSLRIREKIGDKYGIASSYNSIGIIHEGQGDYEKALEFYNKSLELKKELNDQKGISNTYKNIAVIHFQLAEYDNALDFSLKSLKIREQLKDEYSISDSYNNIADIYQKMGELNKALEFYANSLKIKENLKDRYGMADSNLGIGMVHLKRKSAQKAIPFLNTSLEIAKQTGAKEMMENSYYQLSLAYEQLLDHKKSLKFYKLYATLKDSLFNQAKTQQITEMQTKYESEKKEQQIASQLMQIDLLERKEAADRNLRIALIFGAILLLVSLIFIYSRYHLKQRAEKALRSKNQEIAGKNSEIQLMNKELEKRLLRAQMDPHFIFNSLNSIQHFITINDKDSALRYLSKFSKLIRQVLENAATQMVPIADEIKLLENYLQLEALRFDHKFEHSIEVDEKLDIYNTDIPFLMIQPYVENSIVHGLQSKEGGGKLKIKLENKMEHILCTVEDNGVGRQIAAEKNEQRSKDHTSRGMSVTRKRLELLNRYQKSKTLVKVIDLQDATQKSAGTKVEIQIPFDLN